MEEGKKEGDSLCETICHGSEKIKWNQIEKFLKEEFPSHYAQLSGSLDEDGFVRVGAKRGNFFRYWRYCDDLRDNAANCELYYQTPMVADSEIDRPLDQLLSPEAYIWDFTKRERRMVLDHWKKLLRDDWIDNIVVRAQGYQVEVDTLEKMQSEYQRRVLENADVIGITTTGLARNAALLRRLRSKTLICEEAGEVLEVFMRRELN